MYKLEEDLEHVFQETKNLWTSIKNQQIFITGGTGFFGKWLLHSFLYINKQLNLNNALIVLTRNEKLFLSQNPVFSNQTDLNFIEGDIRTFSFPDDLNVDYIIHAATEASASLNLDQPLLMYDTIVEGTRRVLDLAKRKNVKAILHTSSGAVYGKQPYDLTHIYEDYQGSPDIYSESSAYGEGKRVSEMLASVYYKQYGVKSKIARCFAFMGPYLPLDGSFAAGNFIKNVIEGKDITINGDGTPYRSYLYASDLVIWLLKILFEGKSCRPYNVGSDEELTIRQLAYLVAENNEFIRVNLSKPEDLSKNALRYVPSINRIKSELGVKVNISLRDAISKTLIFYTAGNG